MEVDFEKLAEKLQSLELSLARDWGLKNISGGFVHLKYESHDNKKIYLTCKSGVQNDVDDDVVEEQLEMDINKMVLL